MVKIGDDWSAYDVFTKKYNKTWQFITYVNVYCRYVQMVLELAFLCVVVRNWCHPARKMSSIFFILFSLRVANDLVYNVLDEANKNKWVNLKSFMNDNAYFDAFTLEFDTILHIVICVNRFTAIMVPFGYHKIWNVRNNFIYLVLILILSAICCYADVEYYRAFDYIRAVLSFICFVILTLFIFIRTKTQSNASQLIKKTDKQLLYDTIFTATVMVLTNVNYIFIDTNPYMSFETFFVLASFDDFVYNSFFAVSIVFLFYISTAARDGLKLAIPWCGMWKTETEQRGISHMTRVTTVLPTNRTWLTPIK